jgi:malate dehydrogenase (oxaloacetate-decarboxylating)
VPEIDPKVARKASVAVFGTARADLPNQINNVLGFPGIFRGALAVRSRRIEGKMKLAAAHALAGVISGDEISREHVVPLPFDRRVVPSVASAVAEASMKTGEARVKKSADEVQQELSYLGLLG